MSHPHSHYDNLELAHDAPPSVIKAARDALLLKYSVENYPNDVEESKRIRDVLNASYDVLITPEKRAAHDAWLVANSTKTMPSSLIIPKPTPRPIEPILVKEQNTNHGKNSKLFATVLVGGLLLAVVIGLVFSNNSNKSKLNDAVALPSEKNSPITVINKPQQSSAVFEPDLGVASINANLREFDSVKSKILRVVPRATLVKKISLQGTFVQVQLADGSKGWIAEELLLPQADVVRLSSTTAKDYIQANSGEARMLESWNTVFPSVTERLTSLFLQLEQKNPAILNNIALLEFVALDKPKLDASALVWFGQSVLLEKENVKPTEALLASRAAVVAAPYDAGAYTALGMAAYEAGDKISLDSAALMALGLSPKTTNTWVVMGLSLGADVKTSRHAVGAFMLAIKFSRNGSFTKKYLLDLADKATNPNLPPVLREAVNEMNLNPSSFIQK